MWHFRLALFQLFLCQEVVVHIFCCCPHRSLPFFPCTAFPFSIAVDCFLPASPQVYSLVRLSSSWGSGFNPTMTLYPLLFFAGVCKEPRFCQQHVAKCYCSSLPPIIPILSLHHRSMLFCCSFFLCKLTVLVLPASSFSPLNMSQFVNWLNWLQLCVCSSLHLSHYSCGHGFMLSCIVLVDTHILLWTNWFLSGSVHVGLGLSVHFLVELRSLLK